MSAMGAALPPPMLGLGVQNLMDPRLLLQSWSNDTGTLLMQAAPLLYSGGASARTIAILLDGLIGGCPV